MKRLSFLTLFAALFALLLLPANPTQAAVPVPVLHLQTELLWLEVTYGQPTNRITAPVLFENTGNGPLEWEAFSSSYGCARTNGPAWLSVSPGNGNLRPKHATSTSATIDLTQLEIGRHEAVICLLTNDPRRPFTSIPVTMLVNSPPPAP